MTPTTIPPSTGTTTTQPPRWFPAGVAYAVLKRPYKAMLVTSQMSRVRTCATTPAASAISTASTLTNTTRRSTSARSGGTRAASSAGAIEGATGIPSVVAPVTTSSTGMRAPARRDASAPRPAGAPAILEEHRRCSAGELHPVDHLEQPGGEPLPPARRELPHGFDQPLLQERRRGGQQGPPARGETQVAAPAVLGRPAARDQARRGQALHHRRDGALVGERPLRQLGDRPRLPRRDLLQDEQLRAGDAYFRFGLAGGLAQR